MRGKRVEPEQIMQEVTSARSDLAQLLEMVKSLTVLTKMVETERNLIDVNSRLLEATKKTEQACNSLLSYDEREKAIVGHLDEMIATSRDARAKIEALKNVEDQIMKLLQVLQVEESKLSIKAGELIGREAVAKEREERMKRLEAFDAELASKKQQLADWEKELDSRDRRISDREKHLTDLESYMAGSMDKLKDSFTSLSSSGVELVNLQRSVNNSLTDLQSRIEKSKTEWEEIQAEKKALDFRNVELSNWQKELGLKDDKLTAYSRDVKELESKKQDLQAEIDQMAKEKESILFQAHARLEGLFKELASKVSELEDDVRGRGIRLEELISREKDLESKLKQSEGLDDALKDAQGKMDVMTKQIAELDSKRSGLLDEIHGLETKRDELGRLISATRKTV